MALMTGPYQMKYVWGRPGADTGVPPTIDKSGPHQHEAVLILTSWFTSRHHLNVVVIFQLVSIGLERCIVSICSELLLSLVWNILIKAPSGSQTLVLWAHNLVRGILWLPRLMEDLVTRIAMHCVHFSHSLIVYIFKIKFETPSKPPPPWHIVTS